MKDYSKAKIYKIVCNVSGLVYIGSTCEPTLARRLAKHVGNYKVWSKDNSKTSYMTSYKILEGNDYDIVLIEEVQCETKDQLHARERYHIESIVCVNKVIPTRTTKEYKIIYRDEHKDEIKNYWDKHKEEINAKKRLVCNCSCGKTYTKSHKSHHERLPFHLNYLKSQTEINDDNLPCSLDGLELESN